MTSTTDTDRHPDISEISDLVEGLLSASRAADLHDHVESCTLCSNVHTSLNEIRSLLGTLPGPPAMPDDIARRINATLAAEVSSTAVDRVEAHPVSRETEPAAEGHEDRQRTAGGPHEHSAVESAPAIGHRPPRRSRGARDSGPRPGRRRRRMAILSTALGAAVVGIGVVLLPSVQPFHDAAGETSDSGAATKDSSGQTFSEGTLKSRVYTLLVNTAEKSQSRGNAMKEPPTGMRSGPDGVSLEAASPRSPLTASAVPVPPCVQQGTGRQSPALAVEEGRYQGTDAFLVVLPHATDSHRVQAYVVDATCIGASPEAKGRLMLTRSYSRR